MNKDCDRVEFLKFLFKPATVDPHRRHRDLKPLPVSPVKKRERIKWLLEHPVWTYPRKVKVPPEDADPETVFDVPRDSRDFWVVPVGCLQECWSLDLVFVDPMTETIEDDGTRNTAFRVWIEAGPWIDHEVEKVFPEPDEGWNHHNRWGGSHDSRLDCGGSTMEEALLELASAVEVFYKEDGSSNDLDWCESPCTPDTQGFCESCGFLVEKDEESEEDQDKNSLG